MRYSEHMLKDAQDLYLEALKLVNLSHLARKTGRGRRTLVAYQRKEFKPSTAAIQELVQYLREEARTLTAAADGLLAEINEEESRNE